MVQACNPSYLVWCIAQGVLPLAVVQRQLEAVSEKIRPEFAGEACHGQERPSSGTPRRSSRGSTVAMDPRRSLLEVRGTTPMPWVLPRRPPPMRG
jgi:hypothetical protein